MRSTLLAILVIPVAGFAWAGHHEAQHELPRHASPDGAVVYIIGPKDGATLSSPVRVQFGLRGMGVAPAGVDLPNTGHHHLVIDTELPDLDAPFPTSPNNIHFGKGQTETTLDLEPGEHTLQLLLGDMNPVPHQPPVISKRITVTVK